MASSVSDPKDPSKLPELVDISKAIELLCVLNINDLRTALRTLEGGALGVFLGDNTNKQAVNIEKISSALPRHLLAHIVTGERNFSLSNPKTSGTGWLAHTAKGLHLLNCFVSLEYMYPRLAAVQRGLEHRSCILDSLLLAGAVWNTELAGATTFPHYVLCAEGIRLSTATLGTALQQDLDRGADSSKSSKSTDSAASSSSSVPQSTSRSTNDHSASTNGNVPSNAAYLYEWYDALLIHPKLTSFVSLPIDTINLLQHVTFKALASCPEHIPKLCRSFHTQLEAFYLMCCSEEFVGHLLLHPIFVGGGLLSVLQQSLNLWKCSWSPSEKQALTASGVSAPAAGPNTFQQNDPVASVVNQILYVLFEKETPCFLDAVAASSEAFRHMQTIISIVTQMSSRILDTSTCGPSAIESFKLIEILSDDSNFKNEVIARTTPLLLKLLSFPPATIEALFALPPAPASAAAPTPQYLQRDFMIVVFRVVGNLHCFNENVCKAEDEGMFLRATVAEMANSTKSNNSNSNTSTKQTTLDSPQHVMTNLNLLLQRLSMEHQVYHLNSEELELATSFTNALQLSLSAVSVQGSHKRKHNDP